MSCRSRHPLPNQSREIIPLDSEPVLARLQGLHPRVIDLSLGRVHRLLATLGHPERQLPPVVHVAGTNGKGSTIAFLRAMLEAAGLRVHVLTSPHLVRFSERIVVAGVEISDPLLVEVLETCETANAGDPITFFEITTVAALLAFDRVAADIALLETGLGGRLDATNVLDQPALTAITPVSVDHQAFLGETLVAIAAEKAGILKPGVAAVVAAQQPEAADAIRGRAADIDAPLAWQGVDWSIETNKDRTVYTETNVVLDLPIPGLPGTHQIGNAGVAVACARKLGERGVAIGTEDIAAGLLGVRWPGRLQRLVGGQLQRWLPPDWELWVDGGHNEAAAKALADHLRAMDDRPWHLVLGMLVSKDPAAFLGKLAPRIGHVVTMDIPGDSASFPAADLAASARSVGLTAQPADSLETALRMLAESAPGPARVLVAGSLYLAGHALAADKDQSTDSTHS